MPPDDLSPRGIEHQRRRMTRDLGSTSDTDAAWKALIATALRRNVVVAVGEHRALVEAAVLRERSE